MPAKLLERAAAEIGDRLAARSVAPPRSASTALR
jgi:hypothetical protein